MTQENMPATWIHGGAGPAPPDGGPLPGDRFDLKDFERLPVREVPVHALSPGLPLRLYGTSASHVQLLMEVADSAELPPVLVQQDGCRVIDGLHRLEAAKLRGDDLIRARLLDCTDSEALVLAMEANRAHGLPLSKADRVGGAKRVLAAHPDWSDRAIAGVTGLSPKTIASLRSRSEAGVEAGAKRLGRDGRRRPVTAGEGRRRAADYLQEHPEAPMREVARETDVSLGTVQDVSARLRRGDSPERNRQQPPVAAALPALHPVDRIGGRASAPAVTSAPRRGGHDDAPGVWAEVAASVAKDPTVRYTEGGKEFLRWMAMHANDPEGWRTFVRSVPPHWIGVLAPIADGIAREWCDFAEQLRHGGSGAVGA